MMFPLLGSIRPPSALNNRVAVHAMRQLHVRFFLRLGVTLATTFSATCLTLPTA